MKQEKCLAFPTYAFVHAAVAISTGKALVAMCGNTPDKTIRRYLEYVYCY
jgi:hypothetical protein